MEEITLILRYHKKLDMKKGLHIFVLLFTMFLLTGCPKDDVIKPINDSNSGTWYLKNVNGGFAGVDVDYNNQEVQWTFTDTDSTLEVVNNIINTGPQSIYAGPESGTYSYSVQLISGSDHLFIDNEDKGILIFQNDSLFLDEGVAADGFMSVFTR